MVLGETIQQHIKHAQSSAQVSIALFSLRSESFTLLQALGVPKAYHLSFNQQGVLVDAFAAALAKSKQEGWFAIDTLLADMRKDKQHIREQHEKMTHLKQAHGFFRRKAEKRSNLLPQESQQVIESALSAVQYTYNVTLRRETSRLTSPQRLKACRRTIREQGARMRANLMRVA